MNPQDSRPKDQYVQEEIDRLVDDELSQAERRAIIERLERLPDGWRRCALAFLEAQCWRRAIAPEEPCESAATPGAGLTVEGAPLAAETRVAPRRPTITRRQPSSPSASRPLRTALAMAASFLVAFALGAAWRWGWLGMEAGDAAATGPQVADAPETFDGVRPVESPIAPGSSVPDAPSALARDEAPAQSAESGVENPRPLGTVRLSVPVGGDGPARSIELPVLEGGSLGAEWLGRLPAAVPPEVVRALEHSGMNVEQQRDVLRFRTPDGRALVVPVERLEVTRAEGPKL